MIPPTPRESLARVGRGSGSAVLASVGGGLLCLVAMSVVAALWPDWWDEAPWLVAIPIAGFLSLTAGRGALRHRRVTAARVVVSPRPYRFNTPPGWPPAPAGYRLDAPGRAPVGAPPPPPGWQFWIPEGGTGLVVHDAVPAGAIPPAPQTDPEVLGAARRKGLVGISLGLGPFVFTIVWALIAELTPEGSGMWIATRYLFVVSIVTLLVGFHLTAQSRPGWIDLRKVYRFNPPPGWPAPLGDFWPVSVTPPPPGVPPAPPGWVFWVPRAASDLYGRR